QLQVKAPLEWLTLPVLMGFLIGVLGAGGLSYRQFCAASWPVCPSGGISLPGGSEHETPTPPATTETATMAPEATPTPEGIYVNGRARVVNSDPNPPNNTNCFAVRSGDTPVLDRANVQDRMCTGTIV